MLKRIKKKIINILLEDDKIFKDGTVVKYENNKLKIYPSENINIEFNGKINFYSDYDITIQSEGTLRLRGETLHLNDHKPAEDNFSYVLVKNRK